MMTQIRKRSTRRKAPVRCCPGIADLMQPRFFKALCDPSRVALLVRLVNCCRPCGVSELARCCPTDLSVVSRHLATLRDAGILTSEKRGKEVYYSVPYDTLVSTLRAMADAIEACCVTKKSNRKGC